MLNMGFYIPVLGNTEKDYNLLLVINAIAKFNIVTLFNSTILTKINYSQSFVTLPCNQAKYYTGSLIMRDIQSVSVTKDFPCPKHKIFLIDDIFWVNKSTPYTIFHKLYYNSGVKFVSTNNNVKSLLEICFDGVDNHIQNISDIEEIKNVIETICSS